MKPSLLFEPTADRALVAAAAPKALARLDPHPCTFFSPPPHSHAKGDREEKGGERQTKGLLASAFIAERHVDDASTPSTSRHATDVRHVNICTASSLGTIHAVDEQVVPLFFQFQRPVLQSILIEAFLSFMRSQFRQSNDPKEQ